MARRKTSTALRDLNDREHVLYRFWNVEDVLLYVGITVDSPSRIASHMRDKAWWGEVDGIKFTKYPNRQAALEAEAEMIRTLKPLYNVQHNEMADDEEAEADETSEYLDLICDAVAWGVGKGDWVRHLKDQETDGDGEPRDPAIHRLAAVLNAVYEVMRQRDRLDSLVDHFMNFIPEGLGYQLHAASVNARRDRPHGFSDTDVSLDMLERYTSKLAGAYLALLAEDEAKAWRERAVAVNSPPLDHVIELWAARHAFEWKENGQVYTVGCAGPGQHGALCAQPTETQVWYEICPLCQPGRSACEGHRVWCLEHTKAAVNGSLSILETAFGNYPIARWEKYDPWAVPF
jgi:predicted GIY-YIG superfamily endonuclease